MHHDNNCVVAKDINGKPDDTYTKPNEYNIPNNAIKTNIIQVHIDIFLLNKSSDFLIIFNNVLVIIPYNATTIIPNNIPNFANMPANAKSAAGVTILDKA